MSDHVRHPCFYRHRSAGIGIRYTIIIALAIYCCLLLGLPGQASAAGYATISMGPDKNARRMQVEWRDTSTARFDMGSSGYALLRDGKLYMVSGGRVFSADTMRSIFSSGMGGDANGRDSQARPVVSGPFGSETVAGIRGDLYRITYGDRTSDVVLTDNPLVKELTRVWIVYASTMGGHPLQTTHVFHEIYGGRGELRVGRDFRLASIDDRMPPASDFVLPSGNAPGASIPGAATYGSPATYGNPAMPATDRQSQQQASADSHDGNDTGSSSGSGFLGNIENRLDRTEQRQGDHVDNRVNGEAGKVVNHMLDHLFGN